VAQAYDLYLTEDRPFGFAGLCEGWEKDADLPLESCVIIFVPPDHV
jgi:putative SOS response-associated peptidase YedK